MTPKLPINLDSLLHQRTIEGERIEYKKGWNPEAVLHTICAFANDFQNLGGGYIIIGIEELNGQPLLPPSGIKPEQVDSIQKKLLNLGNSHIQPSYHPLTATYTLSGKLILVLWVPGGETRPYKARINLGKKEKEWAFYLRKHSNTVRAKGSDERELFSLAATVPFDDRYHQRATLDDLSPRLIREFLQEIDSELAESSESLNIEELGRRMNVVGGPTEMVFPKNVGLLFFNERPETFFPYSQIDVVYFPDGPGGDLFEEKEFRGPLGQITRDAVSYIERSYLKEMVVKHSNRPEADRFWNFPLAAIEEAVVNAIYHRSYEIREPVEVRITPQELVVLSYPGPDLSIRMNDLQAGRAVSRRYRNRRIGEFLKELDLTEGRSTGIPKILRKMRTNGSPAPIFESDDERTYFLIKLPVHKEFETVATPYVTAQARAHVTAHVKAHVTDEVKQLLEVLQGAMSRSELMTALNVKSRRHFSSKYLQSALNEGFIEMTLPDKPTSTLQRYMLSEAGKRFLKEGSEATLKDDDATSIAQISEQAGEQAGEQADEHISAEIEALLGALGGEMKRAEIMDILGVRSYRYFREKYLQPALDLGLIEMTIPDKPSSPKQKYRQAQKAHN